MIADGDTKCWNVRATAPSVQLTEKGSFTRTQNTSSLPFNIDLHLVIIRNRLQCFCDLHTLRASRGKNSPSGGALSDPAASRHSVAGRWAGASSRRSRAAGRRHRPKQGSQRGGDGRHRGPADTPPSLRS